MAAADPRAADALQLAASWMLTCWMLADQAGRPELHHDVLLLQDTYITYTAYCACFCSMMVHYL